MPKKQDQSAQPTVDPSDPNLVQALFEFYNGSYGQGLAAPMVIAWISEHQAEMTTSQFYEVLKNPSLADMLPSLGTKAAERWKVLSEGGGPTAIADTRLGVVAQGGAANPDLDGDGRVDPSEQALMDSAKTRLATEQAKDSGRSVDVEKANIDAVSDIGLGLSLTPPILTEYMGQTQKYATNAASGTTGDPAYDTRISELIREWNNYNPDRPIKDQAELFKVLNNPNDPDVKNVMDAVFYGKDPLMDYKVKLANGAEVTISAAEFDAYQQGGFAKYGALDRLGLANTVRIADRIGLTTGSGGNGWQMIAALTRAKHLDTEQARFTEPGYKGPKDTDVQKSVYNAQKATSLGMRFKEGQYIYANNDTLSYLHALDPTLAAKVANTPNDLSQSDVRRLQQLTLDGGFDQNALAGMGYAALGIQDWLNDPAHGGGSRGGGGGGRQRPDPVAVKQAAKDMWVNLFASEPTEAQLASLIANLDLTISGAPSNQQVDVQAQIRKGLEADPQYKELYSARPAGMSEAEYQSQFRGGAASLLGQQAADPNAIRSGMRSGQYQTTLGAIAGSKQAWGNSTFRGRLAQAAQIVGENT